MGRTFFHNNRLYFTDKMKRYFIVLLMSLVSFAVPAQNNQKIIDHINLVAHSLKSMQADFIQTKTMKMSRQPIISVLTKKTVMRAIRSTDPPTSLWEIQM